MRTRTLLAASAVLLATLTAKADTSYIYTGQNFSSALAPVTTTDSLSGYFTIAGPLAASSVTYVSSDGAPAGALDPSSWSFTDGVTTFNQTNSLFGAELITNSSDSISYWSLSILGPVNGVDQTFFTTSVATANGFYDVINGVGGASVSTTKGTFAVGNPPPATPEPASIALLGTALVGSLTAFRKRNRAR